MSASGRHPWDANDPYPEDYPEHDCDHMDYEVDILTGVAKCACGDSWTLTAADIERERKAQIDYDRMCERWEREQRSLRGRARALLERVRALWRRPAATGDEIPF